MEVGEASLFPHRILRRFEGCVLELPIPFLIVIVIYTVFVRRPEAAALTVVYVLFIKMSFSANYPSPKHP